MLHSVSSASRSCTVPTSLKSLKRSLGPSCTLNSTATLKMPSSKGEPTDPELREQVKEEVKNEEKGLSPLRPTLQDHTFDGALPPGNVSILLMIPHSR